MFSIFSKVFFTVLVFIMIFLFGFGGAVGSETSMPAAQKEKATVFTEKVAFTEIHDHLVYPAKVVPKVISNINADIDGVVDSILKKLGDKVSSGEAVSVLKHTDPLYQYAKLKVFSPIKGLVSAVHVSEGQQVNRGQKLLEVTDPQKIKIIVEIPSFDLVHIRNQKRAEIKSIDIKSSDNENGSDSGKDGSKEIYADVIGLSPNLDPVTQTASCELESKQYLFPHSLIQVIFEMNKRKSIMIPEEAIFYKNRTPM
ncbi:MAG: HlyD family efflux transporter periplasmic adaptor subunit, partial [Oligoflexia bacterium]|nr:HlyD family efflux transporter periplasmic adaptor subunit [Oligoflexia bacterium]